MFLVKGFLSQGVQRCRNTAVCRLQDRPEPRLSETARARARFRVRSPLAGLDTPRGCAILQKEESPQKQRDSGYGGQSGRDNRADNAQNGESGGQYWGRDREPGYKKHFVNLIFDFGNPPRISGCSIPDLVAAHEAVVAASSSNSPLSKQRKTPNVLESGLNKGIMPWASGKS